MPSPKSPARQGTTGRRARRWLAAAAAHALLSALAVGAAPRPAAAQWSTVYEQFYLQAPHNWVFRNNYQGADRLFNAFDYGHAILYEKLWTKPDAPASILEEKEYDFLTKKVLARPPRVPLEEGAIEIKYVQLAPEAKQMFEWAHILHRQLYDVLADERLDQAAKDREVQRLIDYYKTRRDVAFSSKPKSMKLMQEQPYSLAFRKEYPKFNGLIWGYHWLQVGLYEPLLVGRTVAERQAGVRATVARFWQMLQDPPRTFPYQMPMTPAVAPTFAARYQEAAIIFDNLHSMHDVISDILANDSVPRDRKRAEILLAARRFRDDTSYVMTPQAWLTMAQHMGIENMGGPSVGFQTALPTPTVTYGAVMSHDDRTGQMVGFRYGQATGGAHAGHGATPSATPPAATTSPAGAEHAGHGVPRPAPRDSARHDPTRHDPTRRDAAQHDAAQHDPAHHGAMRPGADSARRAAAHHTDSAHGAVEHDEMMALHRLMLADPVIRARVRADPAMRRLLEATGDASPAPRPAARSSRGPAAKPAARASAPSTSKARARPAARPAPKSAPKAAPAKKPADPHAAHRGRPHSGP